MHVWRNSFRLRLGWRSNASEIAMPSTTTSSIRCSSLWPAMTFKGRALLKPSTPTDYSNFIVACLTHDIGYIRGVVKGDKDDGYVVDSTGRKISLPRGSSDAALGPYHVERSQLFVLDRVAAIEELDSARIGRAIAFTRFPYPSPADEKEDEHGINEEGALLRAADLIGQLGDPHYLRKANALYYEFEEIGLNRQFGYESPADIVDKYPQFYWNSVSPPNGVAHARHEIRCCRGRRSTNAHSR